MDRLRADLSEALSRLITPADIAKAAATEVGQVLRAECCVYIELDNTGEQQRVLGAFSSGDDAPLALGRLWRELARDKRGQSGATVVQDRGTRFPMGSGQTIRPTLFVPITAGHEPQAVLGIRRGIPEPWTWEDVTMAQVAVERVAGAIECARTSARLEHAQAHAAEVESKARDAAAKHEHVLAVLAHELRNPLAPIRTAVAVMGTDGTVDPTVMRCRDVIKRQVSQLSRVLEDLLDASRLSRAGLELRKEPTWLRDVLSAALETTRPLLEQKGLRLRLSGTETSVALHADRTRLTQAVTNVLLNAVKFTPAGGEVGVSAVDGEGHVTITVSDSGIGMASDKLAQLFEPFADAPTKAAGTESGLGLGLSLARHVVLMHGGTISAASAGPGAGSTFTLRLPCVRDAASSPDDGSTSSVPPPERMRVLVADDNVDAADMLATLLRLHGYDVRTTYDGAAALEEAATFQPQVVILDLGLPGVNGVDIGRELRRQARGGSLFIVAVTGWGRQEDRERTARAGFDQHLVKPIDPDTLLQAIEAHRRPPPDLDPPSTSAG